jgi:hypothetical protein
MPIAMTIPDPVALPALVWTEQVEDAALDQLCTLARQPGLVGRVAAMPDVHYGLGSTMLAKEARADPRNNPVLLAIIREEVRRMPLGQV